MINAITTDQYFMQQALKQVAKAANLGEERGLSPKTVMFLCQSYVMVQNG